MHVDRDSPSMDTEMERTIARHPRAGGNPVPWDPLDSHVCGNDPPPVHTVCLHSRVHNTLYVPNILVTMPRQRHWCGVHTRNASTDTPAA
jgi:hypothetical protein